MNQDGFLIVQNIKCYLNHDINLKSRIFRGEKVKLLFEYNGVDKATERADVMVQGDKRQLARFNHEQIIFPVVKNVNEFEISVYDALRPGYDGPLGNVTVNLNNSNGKVTHEIFKSGRRTGEISFCLTLLSMDTPSDNMMRIFAEEMIQAKIGMILIENIKIKNFTGRTSFLELRLNDEYHSTKGYWYIESNKELKVALPLICTKNPSLKLQINYGISKGVTEFYLTQFGDIWKRMVNGEVANVGEQVIYSAGEICAKLKFDISCRRIVKPREFFSDLEQERQSSREPDAEAEILEENETASSDIPPPRRRASTISRSQTRSVSPSMSISSIRTRSGDLPLRVVCQRYMVVSDHQGCSSITTGPLRNKLSRGKHIYTPGEFFIKDVCFKNSFHNEIKWLEKLQSKWIVKWIDMDISRQIIVTKNHGSSLDSVHRRFCRSKDDLLNLYKSICEGVSFLHRNNVVHMDLCPANIICKERIVRNRREIKIRICDFEYSRECGNPINLAQNYTPLSRQDRYSSYNEDYQNQQVFALGFTAPELLGITHDDFEEQVPSLSQQSEELSAEFSMDIFALSGILYFLWVKRLMYNNIDGLRVLLREEFEKVEQDIANEGVAKLVLKMSKEPPEDRCDIDDVLQDLRGLMGNGRRRGTRDRDYLDDDD